MIEKDTNRLASLSGRANAPQIIDRWVVSSVGSAIVAH